ncbi:MAG: beta-propeller domain-containing protein [Patescibacteria group bacterium]|jgi:uncharacterized secreted protein with C-terminal beta-propeller domain
MFLQRRLDSYVALVSSLIIVFIGATLYIGLDHKLNQTADTKPSPRELHYPGNGYFTSADDFKSFLQESSSVNARNYSNARVTDLALPNMAEQDAAGILKSTSGASRYSQTNVQVAGIDEPDIVKTNGQEIFISTESPYYGAVEPAILEEDQAVKSSASSETALPAPTTPTRIVSALPADKAAVASTLAKTGPLLYAQDTLVVFSTDKKVTGYNVADQNKPTQSWTYDIDGSYLTARLWQNKIYLIVDASIDESNPCPIQPLATDHTTITIPCNRVYHPAADTAVDSTYSVMKIDPATGQVEQSLSFVGSTDASTVYVSPNAIYLTHPAVIDYAAYSYTSMIESALTLLPTSVQDKITRLNTYDISIEAKYTELQSILDDYYNSLTAEDRLRQQTAIEKSLDAYFQEHRRELEKTGLTKITLSDLTVTATGEVPGYPLNQFSIDEYQGNLRIATTSSSQFSSLGSGDTANDIYVFDSKLDKIGQLQNLGLGETIYSARFVGNRGYLVTFRQTDPFFVLDLSDPRKPELKGELKIPGYSSYLHPLTDTLVLGVGAESSHAKLSLFDVTDANKPIELANQKLDDYWSEAQNNHHAFLQDAQHKVFFLPGGTNGYVYSYDANTLTLAKKVDGLSMKRAVYLDNNLYIIGESSLVVLDETNWNQVGQLQYPTN